MGVLLLCGPTWADARAAKRLYGEATKAYKLGRFNEAASLYKRAYDEEKLPGFLFNIGQAHYKAKDYEEAIFFYGAYLRDKPQAKNRSTVRRRIAAAKKALERARAEAEREAERQRQRLAQERLAQQADAAKKQAEAAKKQAEAEQAAQARAEAEAEAAAAERARHEAAQQLETERRRAAEAEREKALAESEGMIQQAWFWPTIAAVGVGGALAVAAGVSFAGGGLWLASAANRDSAPALDFSKGAE